MPRSSAAGDPAGIRLPAGKTIIISNAVIALVLVGILLSSYWTMPAC
jgi:hypothetical protein